MKLRSLVGPTATRLYHGTASAGTGAVVADLRSDTVTTPTRRMRQAMADAPCGDDVMMEDATVVALEQEVASMCDKEAGIFMASGTMTNQVALALGLGRLSSVVCDRRAHIYMSEAGGIAANTGATVYPVTADNGHYMTAEEVEETMITVPDVHSVLTKMISVENTLWGGIMPETETEAISVVANRHSAWLHMDGARLWEAHSATGLSMATLTRPYRTVSLCLSKGLGAPIGSVLVGSTEDITRARHVRKQLGGGWRQAGVLAAAAHVALHDHLPRLNEVHNMATTFAAGLRAIGFTVVDPQTNWAIVDLAALQEAGSLGKVADVVQSLKERGVLVGAWSKTTIRCVFHVQISKEGAAAAVDAFASLLSIRR